MKRYDGEPLTRTDVQHAMLCYLFSDTRRVFTNPRPGSRGAPMSTFVQHVATAEEPKEGASEDRHALKNAPPSVQACVASAMAGPFPTYVWPYGQSAGSARRADETPEELAAWEQRRAAYLGWRDAHYPASITPRDELPDDAPSPWAHTGEAKLTFKELYIEALMNSSKCTKSMREKCFLDEEYAEDFSKVCLLVNVGRINTTLAFYPEMKTILRSYHPVPSLQKSDNTRRNMQDAPRMKSLLKAVLLPYERPGGAGTASASARHDTTEDTDEVPTTLSEVARRYRVCQRPPTSVVTMIFLLMQQAPELTALHFPPPHDVYTLFFPAPGQTISARDRANAFLWLLYHYLEGPASAAPGAPGVENPFDDDVSRAARAEAHAAWVQQGSEPLPDAAPLWPGVPNPAYAAWREEHESALDALQEHASARRASRKRGADAEDTPDIPPCPVSHTHRLLLPALPPMPADAYAREDADSPDEVAWGVQMQDERSAFLQRFQEEEQAKVLAQGGVLDDAEHGRADDAKPKKRISVNTQSCYPLANILANAAAAGSHTGALTRSPIGFVKRARLSSRQSHSREHGTPSDLGFDDAAGGADDAAAPCVSDRDLRAAAQPPVSLVDDAWHRASAHEDYDSDGDVPDDSAPALARTLLTLRRLQHARRAGPDGAD